MQGNLGFLMQLSVLAMPVGLLMLIAAGDVHAERTALLDQASGEITEVVYHAFIDSFPGPQDASYGIVGEPRAHGVEIKAEFREERMHS